MKWFEIRMVVVSALGLCLLLAVNVSTARADFTFGRPVNLGPPINTGHGEWSPFFSADGLELLFARWESGTHYDIYVARRPTVDSEWGIPVNLGPPVNSSDHEHSPSISADGLTLYLIRGVYPTARLYMAKRATTNDDWDPPVLAGGVVNTHHFGPLSVSTDDLELYFGAFRPGGYGNFDLWLTRRATINGEWGTPINLGPTINSSTDESWPAISPDRLLLFFTSTRPGGFGSWDIYVARRVTREAPWGPPMNLGPIMNSGYSGGLQVSHDGSTLYFHSDRPGGYGGTDIWQAPIIPIVDFNGDGVVDTKDLVKLIDSWGQADPLCDIGPFAWGDGVVDAADLEVFMRYWGQEAYDPTLTGHWPFDEAEGMIAHDLAGANDATILGLPQWQPEGGKIDGALELNGMTFGTATSPVNPASGPFSVLAWVQGGAPGQVILSQQGGANWLMANPATGALMTEVGPPGRTGPGLISDAVITDGNWHRIAFTWDGANRWLYVDGVLVAEDARDDLPSCSGKLVFGASKDMAPGTFFTGLIDEVRIYNRVVWP